MADSSSYVEHTFEDINDAMRVYGVLFNQQICLIPQVLPPEEEEIDNSTLYKLQIRKSGKPLDDFLMEEMTNVINCQNQLDAQRDDGFLWDGGLFEYLYENGRLVTVQATYLYSKIIRDLFTIIRCLKHTDIRPCFNKSDIFIDIGGRGKIITTQTVNFELAGGEDHYFSDCLNLFVLLKDINEACMISGSAHVEFDDFFTVLSHTGVDLDDHKRNVLAHPVFWPRDLRMQFMRKLDGLLTENSSVAVYYNYTSYAFQSSNGAYGIASIISDPYLSDALDRLEYHNRSRNTGGLLPAYRRTRGGFDNNREIRLCVEIIRNFYVHFSRIATTPIANATGDFKFQSARDMQRVIQNKFPKHIISLLDLLPHLASGYRDEIQIYLRRRYLDHLSENM